MSKEPAVDLLTVGVTLTSSIMFEKLASELTVTLTKLICTLSLLTPLCVTVILEISASILDLPMMERLVGFLRALEAPNRQKSPWVWLPGAFQVILSKVTL